MLALSNPLEDIEQAALINWADSTPIHDARFKGGKVGDFLFSVPNGGGKLPMKTCIRLKKTGLRSGVPDLFFSYPCGGLPGLFIEMKRRKNSATTENQRVWMDRLEQVGYRVDKCKGWDEAREVILEYLGRKAPIPKVEGQS